MALEEDPAMSENKIDVIDLIIQTLQEHEKKLDELIERLERAINNRELEDWR